MISYGREETDILGRCLCVRGMRKPDKDKGEQRKKTVGEAMIAGSF